MAGKILMLLQVAQHNMQYQQQICEIQSHQQLFSLVSMQLAAVAALCVQYESEFRPSMSIVVKALSPLLTNTPYQAAPALDTPSDA